MTAPATVAPRRARVATPATTHQRTMTRQRRGLLWHLPLALAAVVTILPFWAMLMMSLKPGRPVDFPGVLLPTGLSLDAYAKALSSDRIWQWTMNSAIYSVVSVVLVLLFASMCGYAFAKKRFIGRDVLFWTFVAMMMVPGQLTLVPLFLIVSNMDGLNTMWGLIIPTIANVQAMFLMRQFMQDIPDELIEAAKIDGAGEFRIYWRIILPQTKPILATLGTFVFLWHWNDFLWPLVAMRSPHNYTLTVGLNSLQAQDPSLASVMANATITFVPALFVFLVLQRYFVRGVMMSGLK